MRLLCMLCKLSITVFISYYKCWCGWVLRIIAAIRVGIELETYVPSLRLLYFVSLGLYYGLYKMSHNHPSCIEIVTLIIVII